MSARWASDECHTRPYTQSEFAVLLTVPAVTATSWENGTRKPSGAALRLLAVARNYPEALHAA
jgi:DNA-binding transcriptional regulator YiaG